MEGHIINFKNNILELSNNCVSFQYIRIQKLIRSGPIDKTGIFIYCISKIMIYFTVTSSINPLDLSEF